VPRTSEFKGSWEFGKHRVGLDVIGASIVCCFPNSLPQTLNSSLPYPKTSLHCIIPSSEIIPNAVAAKGMVIFETMKS